MYSEIVAENRKKICFSSYCISVTKTIKNNSIIYDMYLPNTHIRNFLTGNSTAKITFKHDENIFNRKRAKMPVI